MIINHCLAGLRRWSWKKVPAKVPARRALTGLKPIQKDMAGYGLTINATHL
jgi:hypothetical protein